MDVPILGENQEQKPDLNGGPQVRLLFCHQCKTIDELPDYEGDPEYDYLLEMVASKHESLGQRHMGQLMKVPVAIWANPEAQKDITKQIYEKLAPGLDAVMPGFYNIKSQFAEDALSCYNAHLRPKDGCPDYGSDSKVLRPDTKAERKELGLDPVMQGGPKTYLCQFCPVHAMVVQKQRAKAGMYK